MKWVLAAGTRYTCRSNTENVLGFRRETARGTRKALELAPIKSFGAVNFADVEAVALPLDSDPTTECGRSHVVAMAGLIR